MPADHLPSVGLELVDGDESSNSATPDLRLPSQT